MSQISAKVNDHKYGLYEEDRRIKNVSHNMRVCNAIFFGNNIEFRTHICVGRAFTIELPSI